MTSTKPEEGDKYLLFKKYPLTIVGEYNPSEGVLKIALAKYGATTKEEKRKYPYDEKLGKEIAVARLENDQPYTIIDEVSSPEEAFKYACKAIHSHVKMSRQWIYGVRKKRKEGVK